MTLDLRSNWEHCWGSEYCSLSYGEQYLSWQNWLLKVSGRLKTQPITDQ